jgi:WD40 repeat protein
MGGIAAAALFLASIPPASAGIFGGSKNDVAVKVAELPNPDSRIYPLGLEFGVDVSRIAVESQSGKIYVWDWHGNHVEETLDMPRGFGNGMSTNPIHYSPDGLFFAACDASGAGGVVARIWNTADGSIAKDVTEPTSGICTGIGFTPNGQEFIRAADTGGRPVNNLIIYTTGTWQPVWGLRMEGLSPVSIAISPNGEFAAVAGTIFVVPENVKNPIERFQQTTTASKIDIVDLRQRKIAKVIDLQGRTMGPVAWSPDGSRVAIVGGSVEIFDFPSGNELINETIENAGHMNVRYTSDGRYLVDSDLNGMGKGLGIRIWDSQHQKLLQHISVGDVGAIAVSRDGKYLAVGSTGRTTIWQFK